MSDWVSVCVCVCVCGVCVRVRGDLGSEERGRMLSQDVSWLSSSVSSFRPSVGG